MVSTMYLARNGALIQMAELRVHSEPSLWKEYKDTAKEHPMGPVIASVVEAFRNIGSKTLVMPARCVLTSFYVHLPTQIS